MSREMGWWSRGEEVEEKEGVDGGEADYGEGGWREEYDEGVEE